MQEEKDKNYFSNNSSNNNEENKNKLNNEGKKPQINFYWIYGAMALVFLVMMFFNSPNNIEQISMLKLEKELLPNNYVEKIIIVNNEKAEVYIKKDKLKDPKFKKLKEKQGAYFNEGPHYVIIVGSLEAFENKINDINTKQLKNENKIELINDRRYDWNSLITTWILPFGLLIFLWMFIMRRMSGGAGGQIFNIGKSRATLFDKGTNVKINFDDVAGLQEAKTEVREIVDFLKNPKKYTDLGAKIPKGALLVGPPGTGKTLLAKAMAGEAQVPFFSMSGSDFVEMFVGVGASRVRDLFKQAKEKSPCIIFIDEIDAIGRARGKNALHGSNDERENTLNQLLTEMDGFSTNSGVIILAATNRADILDKALMRAGRFDRQIHVELPDLNERKEIFKVHMKPLKIDESVDLEFLSKQTPGFSGADIANVCNEAALIGARVNRKAVVKQDFLDAIDRIIGGLEKKNKIISKNEKKVIAYHEAGHATISWLVKYASPLVKVTIIPRGKALGAAWYQPEERQITNSDQILDEMCAILGGRASEEINFGKVSTGALNDLERATKLAYSMVTIYGLNDKIGNLSFFDSSGESDYSFNKPYSEKTAEIIDVEAKKIIDDSYNRAKIILKENQEKLLALSELLLEKEVIFREDLVNVFGEREFDENNEIIEKNN